MLFYFGQYLFRTCTQTAFRSFPKTPFVWKYYEICKLDNNRGQALVKDGQKQERIDAHAKCVQRLCLDCDLNAVATDIPVRP